MGKQAARNARMACCCAMLRLRSVRPIITPRAPRACRKSLRRPPRRPARRPPCTCGAEARRSSRAARRASPRMGRGWTPKTKHRRFVTLSPRSRANRSSTWTSSCKPEARARLLACEVQVFSSAARGGRRAGDGPRRRRCPASRRRARAPCRSRRGVRPRSRRPAP